jgi:hypothetical protein
MRSGKGGVAPLAAAFIEAYMEVRGIEAETWQEN